MTSEEEKKVLELMSHNEKMAKALYEISQAPYPLHDYCSEESWEFACEFVALVNENKLGPTAQ